MKKLIIALSIAAILVCFCACGNINAGSDDALPNRMVSRIDIAAEPDDDSLSRSYSAQEQLSPIMRMLRELDTGVEPEMSPYQSGEHVRYIITVTYANGNTNNYTIMDNRYFRVGSEDWCEVENEKVAELVSFIQDNPNE